MARNRLTGDYFDRAWPNDTECERLLLGAVFSGTRQQANGAFKRLRGEDFYDEFHGWLFELFRSACNSRRCRWGDSLSMLETFAGWKADRKCKRFTGLPLFAYFIDMLGYGVRFDGCGSPEKINHYVERILLCKKHRTKIQQLETGLVQAWNQAEDEIIRRNGNLD